MPPAIDQAVDRIEQSHLRGEDCALCAELVKTQNRDSKSSKDTVGLTKINVPRVFPMYTEMACVDPVDQTIKERSKHFHPASEDPHQFTLLKV